MFLARVSNFNSIPDLLRSLIGSNPLISHSGGSDCVMLWSPGDEADQGVCYWCGRTIPLAAKPLAKSAAESGRYAG